MEKRRVSRHCAPGRGDDAPTCLTLDELHVLVRQYNRKFVDNPIRIVCKGRTQLYNELRRRLNVEGTDYNMLEHNLMAPVYNKVKGAFRPPKPKSWKNAPNTWLSNFEIDDAMKVYEGQYRDFKYLGTYPVDCPMGYRCPLSGLSISKLKRQGVRRIGVVFNLDYHYEGGSHWVAFYSDFRQKSVEYFDSYGHEPPTLIRQFMVKVAQQLGSSDSMLIYNDRRHQYGGSECGVYSMAYIASRLGGKSAYDMTRHRITDREMFKLRDHFFRKISDRYSET
jgi:hypothetical protein